MPSKQCRLGVRDSDDHDCLRRERSARQHTVLARSGRARRRDRRNPGRPVSAGRGPRRRLRAHPGHQRLGRGRRRNHPDRGLRPQRDPGRPGADCGRGRPRQGRRRSGWRRGHHHRCGCRQQGKDAEAVRRRRHRQRQQQGVPEGRLGGRFHEAAGDDPLSGEPRDVHRGAGDDLGLAGGVPQPRRVALRLRKVGAAERVQSGVEGLLPRGGGPGNEAGDLARRGAQRHQPDHHHDRGGPHPRGRELQHSLPAEHHSRNPEDPHGRGADEHRELHRAQR
mmetsp:Transcript_10994/g.26983  ORF Transcript_10994/g.26983 Transcript_10994/m.26983 type:complete len:279 (-) Transcript_10994:1107-1943(-)